MVGLEGLLHYQVFGGEPSLNSGVVFCLSEMFIGQPVSWIDTVSVPLLTMLIYYVGGVNFMDTQAQQAQTAVV